MGRTGGRGVTVLGRILAGVALGGAMASGAVAQGKPARSPAVQALEFYVGDWSEAGQSRADPEKDFTPLSGGERCEWSGDGQSVICRESVTDVSGTSDALYTLKYDAAAGHYVAQGTDFASSGIIVATGTVTNDVWTWEGTYTVGTTKTAMRYVFKSEECGQRDVVISSPGKNGAMVEMQKVNYTLK